MRDLRILFVLFVCGAVCCANGQPSRNGPETEWVQRAFRFATVACKAVRTERPTKGESTPKVSYSEGKLTLEWSEMPYVAISLDEKSGSVLELWNWNFFDLSQDVLEADAPIEVSEAQAIETGLSLVRAANGEATRWLVGDPQLSTRSVKGGVRRVWSVNLFQEIDGRLADMDRALVTIDAYSGVVAYFVQTERADRLPVEGPVIDERVALRTATDAFYAATRGWVLPGAICSIWQFVPGLAYKSISADHKASRLAATYYFNVRQRDIDVGGGDKVRVGYEVVVDAVTAEVWWIKAVMVTLGSSRSPNISSARFKACKSLLKKAESQELAAILLASTAIKPSSNGRVVGSYGVGDVEVSYTENGVLCILSDDGIRCYDVPMDKRDWCREYFEGLSSLGHSF